MKQWPKYSTLYQLDPFYALLCSILQPTGSTWRCHMEQVCGADCPQYCCKISQSLSKNSSRGSRELRPKAVGGGIFDPLPVGPGLRTYMQYSIVVCSRPEAAGYVVAGGFIRPIVPVSVYNFLILAKMKIFDPKPSEVAFSAVLELL